MDYGASAAKRLSLALNPSPSRGLLYGGQGDVNYNQQKNFIVFSGCNIDVEVLFSLGFHPSASFVQKQKWLYRIPGKTADT